MVSFRERAKWALGGLAIWMMLAVRAVAQDGGYFKPNVVPSPECWPPPCTGSSCDYCEIPNRCPNKCDMILLPPRLCWYGTADGAALRRDSSREFNFASLGGPTAIVLSTRDLDQDFRAAGHCLVGHTFNECFQIEGVFTAVAEDDDTAAVRSIAPNALHGQGNLFSPFGGFGASPVSGLDYNNLAQIRYRSSLQSAELNVRRQVPMPQDRLSMSVLFGVRYIALPETFDYHTESAVPTPSGAINSIVVATDNQMVGPQIGALFEFYVDNRWWLNVEMKAAVLNNHGQQATDYQNINSQAVATEYFNRQSEDHTAFAGELAVGLVYRWSPNIITRIGYQALWLEGVALTPDNFKTDINIVKLGPAQLNHSGGTVYHGPYAGITLGW